MMTEIHNYFETAVDDVYKKIICKKYYWGIYFADNERKTAFLDYLIKYYNELCEYEKCDKILKLKDEINKDISENLSEN